MPSPSRPLNARDPLVEGVPSTAQVAATVGAAEEAEATKDHRDAQAAAEVVVNAVATAASQARVAEATMVALEAQTAGVAPQDAPITLAASAATAPLEVVPLRDSSRPLVDLTVAVPAALVVTVDREATAGVAAGGTDAPTTN